MAHRLDRGTMRKPVELPNGWLRVDALLTRTGVFVYRNPDGTERRELRLDEEVFSPDALGSFALLPVTDDHPPVMLDATNTREYTRGTLSEVITRDGDYVRASMLIQDAELIAKMKAGKVEVSCGYVCDLDETPGEYKGQKYDAIQRTIRGNHGAIVDVGRAGPLAKVRMDSAAEMISASDEQPAKKETVMAKIKNDGIEFEATEQVAALWDKTQAQLVATNKETEQLKAKLDAANEKLAEVEAALKAASDPARVSALVAERVALETSARKILGAEAKLDGKSAREIMTEALAKACPKLDLNARSDEYVSVRFDVACESADAPAKTETPPAEVVTREDAGVARTDEASRRAAMIAHNAKLCARKEQN